jgi:hypothetical protein
MTPARTFGEKIAAGMFDDYAHYFKQNYGIEPRFPHDYKAMRQMGIATGIGGLMGLARGTFWPGYSEKLDEHGRVISKKRRSPWLGALQGAAIGAGTSAISNYAGQTVAQYNPEIDAALQNMKIQAQAMLSPKSPFHGHAIDVSKPLFDKITHTA